MKTRLIFFCLGVFFTISPQVFASPLKAGPEDKASCPRILKGEELIIPSLTPVYYHSSNPFVATSEFSPGDIAIGEKNITVERSQIRTTLLRLWVFQKKGCFKGSCYGDEVVAKLTSERGRKFLVHDARVIAVNRCNGGIAITWGSGHSILEIYVEDIVNTITPNSTYDSEYRSETFF